MLPYAEWAAEWLSSLPLQSQFDTLATMPANATQRQVSVGHCGYEKRPVRFWTSERGNISLMAVDPSPFRIDNKGSSKVGPKSCRSSARIVMICKIPSPGQRKLFAP